MPAARPSLHRLTFAVVALTSVAVGVSTAPPPASATTLLKVGVPQMTQTSQWVVRAVVNRVSDVDLRSEGRGLFTDVELVIRAVYRGDAVPQRYTLRLLGGAGADGVRLSIPGMPTFAPGEEVVLFLEKTSQGHVPCGLGQGVFRVRTGPGKRAWVVQDTAVTGSHLMQRNARGRLEHAPAPLTTPALMLDELIADIYAAQLPSAAPSAPPAPPLTVAPAP